MKSQSMIFGILLALSGFSTTVHASAMNSERAHCFSMESVAADHKKWATSFENFLVKYETLSLQDKFQITARASKHVVHNIELMRDLAAVPADENLLEETAIDIDNAELGDLPKLQAAHILKQKLVRLNEAMANVTFRAQAKNTSCNLGTLNSPVLETN